jgi:all-trans-retinol 13,14-reductase
MAVYDTVIIGSGLGGLQCGYILSKEGQKVCILEQHHQTGGCLQNFTRDGCTFDTGIHYIGGLDEGQVLNQYFKYFGLLDKLKLRKLDSGGFDRIYFETDGREYPYAMGHQNFVDGLAEIFPEERDALKKYVEKLKDVCRQFPLYNLSQTTLDISETSLFGENAAAYIASVTKNDRLRNVLAGTNPLYAGVSAKTPFYVHALVNNSFIESSWRVVDGSSAMAQILGKAIESNGGEIFTGKKAVNFRFHDRDICAIETSDGEVFEARNFISSIHPVSTLRMIPENRIRHAYRERILGLEQTTSNFSLYIVFHKDSFPYLNHNLYYYRQNKVWDAQLADPSGWPYNFLLITPAVSRSDKFADSATVMLYMNYDEVRRWENTKINKRGQDYLDFKQERTERILRVLENHFPGFRKTVKSVYSSSPLTYRDYTGTLEGSLYGVLKDCNDPLRTLISPKTKIPNLYLTGQSIILHGVLGVTIGAVTSCASMLGMDYLVDKINRS